MAGHWKLRHTKTGLFLCRVPCSCENNVNVKSYISSGGLKYSRKINKEAYLSEKKLNPKEFEWEYYEI